MSVNVEIRQPGAEGNPADILIDGERVRGITGYSIAGSVPRSAPVLKLDLSVFEVEYFGEANLHISEGARETLIRFGWTPPTEKAAL